MNTGHGRGTDNGRGTENGRGTDHGEDTDRGKHMGLGSIWIWAGEIRRTEKNIGVSPSIIASELGAIAMEADKRHHETDALVIATAAEFHHRAVWVHPFEDGNRRWARLLANVWLMQHDQPATLWPATDLRNTESPIREYIAAIKQADMRNYDPLIDLHVRFSE